MEKYCPRITDIEIERELEAFGAVLVIGPKWCGKTTSSSRFAKSILRIQDPDKRATYIEVSKLKVSELLKGDKPRLIDEWQDIPQVWDAIRLDVDDTGETGQYILTGSKKPGNEPLHTGTGRISVVRMRTMSLFESGYSNGSVSLSSLFNHSCKVDSASSLDIEDYARLIVRGGWPQSLGKSDEICRRHVKGYCESIVKPVTADYDNKKYNPQLMRDILRSLSRSISAPISKNGIIADVEKKENDTTLSPNTLNHYLSILRDIYVLEEMPSWNPNLRSRTAIRTTDTIHLCDPAIAAYFLSADSADLVSDPNTFGLLFESLAVRDLRVYAEAMEGDVYHYRDKNGLEADAIIHLHDGRWGAVEIKLGSYWIDDAARNLLKIRDRIIADSGNEPSFLAVVTGTEYAYTRDDGVYVIPLGCLRE